MSSLPTRSLSSHLRTSSHAGATAGTQPPALVARIEEKKAELEHLQELRQLSAAVAGQMESLEAKLGTLSDGTEAIAAVVGNWHNVLRAINMASVKMTSTPAATSEPPSEVPLEEAPPPSEAQEAATSTTTAAATTPPHPLLPLTLVRIPTEHAPTVQSHADTSEQDASVNSS